MSTDIDWTIEHETLPADEPSSPEPTSPPSQRPARWLWPVLILAILGLIVLFYLWSLGGKSKPLPNPDTVLEHLEATIQLEITALREGDQEIFSQLQDDQTRRSNLQPAPHGWFAADGELAGDVELVSLQYLDDEHKNSALAEIKLYWDGMPYRLFWFCRQANGRWLHTDWQKVDLGEESTVSENCVEVTYHQLFQAQANALAARVDIYMTELCGMVTCLQRPVTVSLDLAPGSLHYHATKLPGSTLAEDEDWVLRYRLPAPLQIRWPWHHIPEPLVLGSLGRSLAYEQLVQGDTSHRSLEYQAAMTLSTFWIAHHLLDLESPPTTHWLDEAVEAEGMLGFLAFFSALREGVHPSEALEASFQPETLERVRYLPDFFGWRAEVLDPEHQMESLLRLLEPNPVHSALYDPPNWDRDLLVRFNWEVDPRAPDGRVFKRAVPNLVSVVYQGNLADASGPIDAHWATAFAFRQVDVVWQSGRWSRC